jgi:hypothetical protein
MMIAEELICATTEGASTMTVADMPDPEGIYSSLLGAHANTCLLDIPNVRDGNGKLISPSEYEENLEPGAVVMVSVYMKMCVR